MRARSVNENGASRCIDRIHDPILVRQADGVESRQIANQLLARDWCDGNVGRENFAEFLLQPGRELLNVLGRFLRKTDLEWLHV